MIKNGIVSLQLQHMGVSDTAQAGKCIVGNSIQSASFGSL